MTYYINDMNIVKQIEQYDENNVFFCEPIKNNIMTEGSFIRIIYSTHNIVLNGIYLLITLNDITCEKYYTKYRCNFNDILSEISNTVGSGANKRFEQPQTPQYVSMMQSKL